MNIYLRELKVNLKSLIIWSTTLAALGILVMSFFPTIAREAETFEKLLESMPKSLLTAFGLEKISMTDILGFYATKHYITVTLFGSIFAIILSSGILSKEESDKTIEFLLSKPVNRSEIITRKLLSYVTIIFIFNIVVSIALYITLQIVKIEDFSIKSFILLSVGPLLLHLTFASIGFLLSVFVTKSKTVLSVSLGIVLVTYFLSIASALSKKLDFLKYLSPFKYVDATDIITTEKIETKYLVIMAAIIIITITLTYVFYNKKDIS